MPKYFFATENRVGERVTFLEETAHHMLHVLRMKPGAQILLCDGANTDYAAVLREADAKHRRCAFEITAQLPCTTEPPVRIAVFQALPKGDKFEAVVQKCVELGASEIIPVRTAHSPPQDARKKHARCQKIAEAAAAQSMRGIIPTVAAPVAFAEALARVCGNSVHLAALSPSEVNAVCAAPHPSRSLLTLRDTVFPAPPLSAGIWVGPEGGFSADEIAALLHAGAHAVSIGPRVLRTETAAPALLAQLSVLWE